MSNRFGFLVLILLCAGLTFSQTSPATKNVISPGPSTSDRPFIPRRPVRIPHDTGPVHADQQSGADICAKIITAMTHNPRGAEIWVPCGGPGGIYSCTQASYQVPNDGAVPPQQASFKVMGCSSDAGSVNERSLGKVPSTGTIINFTGPSTPTGRFDTRGQGTLEFSGITFMDSGTGCSPFIFDTNTILKIHDNYFYGSTPAYITNRATRLQTSGGSTALKYLIDLGVSSGGVTYRYFVEVKNQGSAPVIVANATQGTLATIPPGTVQQVGFDGIGDGATHLQLQFKTQNTGDAIDILAYAPSVQDRSATNLI
ncbi:MAG TPA: hypothetical protein VN176_04325, partial [Verrucomicrobiae bacterium]|nr:hypothetical protein [Verrucomicrobiae bacterium]